MARLLIADDDIDYCVAFKTGMSALGHDVDFVHSGAEAVAKLNDAPTHYDVIFLDVLMSNGGGASTLHAIRNFSDDLPVVVITGRSEILDSPIFSNGLRQAQKRMSKSSKLSALHEAVTELV
ncbi:response regulator [Cereibacter sphaeroides]|nr:response regulator [Cereibacter sphaeroides]